MHDGFGPLKRDRLVVVCFHKGVDGIPELSRRGETGAAQSRSAQNAEPAFHLIQPGTVGGSEVQMHLRMSSQPAITFRFVGIQIVQDHMDLPARIGSNDIVHKIQKLAPAPSGIVSGLHLSGGDVEGREQGGRPVSLVTVAEAVDSAPVWQP